MTTPLTVVSKMAFDTADFYQMLSLKRADYFGQLILILVSAILLFFSSAAFLVPAYIAVGSWQFLSCLFHFLVRDSLLRQKSRHFFESILVAAPVAVLICLLKPTLFDYASVAMTWLSPVLAFWYCYITRIEMNVWEARALIQLR